MRFADPTSDIAFKKIFGNQERRHILISFLNAVLGFEGDAAIIDLDILHANQAPHLEGFYDSTLDVRARDRSGRDFIVEMQVEGNRNFGKRACYYTAKAYSQQLQTAEPYSTLRPVIFLGILNFNLFDGPEYLSRHLILNQNTMKQEIKEFEFSFIELKKFHKDESELAGIVDQWTYFLRNAGSLKMVPASLDAVPAIHEAFEIADQHLWSEREKEVYDYWLGRERDRLSALESAKEDLRLERGAREQAEADKQKAEAQARREKLVTAESLREMSLTEAQIQKASGIDFAQLDTWIQSGRP